MKAYQNYKACFSSWSWVCSRKSIGGKVMREDIILIVIAINATLLYFFAPDMDAGSALLAGAFASLLFFPIAMIEYLVIEWVFSFFEEEMY
ncbi:MAG: hypothetical protein ACOCP1_01920 [Campylobacterales bacterium]